MDFEDIRMFHVGNPFNGFEIGKNLRIMFDTKSGEI